jgi:hypothetical protein
MENGVYFTPRKDRTFYRQLLTQDSARIFEPDQIEFEVMYAPPDGKSGRAITIL